MQHRTGTDPQGSHSAAVEEENTRKLVIAGITEILDQLEEKTFSSGSRGFMIQGRVTANGKRYMVNIQAVQIDSKPQS